MHKIEVALSNSSQLRRHAADTTGVLYGGGTQTLLSLILLPAYENLCYSAALELSRTNQAHTKKQCLVGWLGPSQQRLERQNEKARWSVGSPDDKGAGRTSLPDWGYEDICHAILFCTMNTLQTHTMCNATPMIFIYFRPPSIYCINKSSGRWH